jgi:hypothetical protein
MRSWFRLLAYSNNAGKYADRFAVSEDGVEMTFATNYLGKLTIRFDPLVAMETL